jgi:uncharacterized protein (UPF0332 family)
MAEYENILILNCLDKSFQAYEDACLGIENKRYSMALNRIYYSIFYSVLALGYKDNFITSKHKQLMGWFNKKYIHEEKIFPEDLMDIYKNAYRNRQESDYEILNLKEITESEINTLLKESKYFIDTVFGYIKT